MKTVTLGRTQLVVPQVGFGALPIQRVSSPEAERIIRKAFDHGVRFFDTARFYSDSEEKLGRALQGVRKDVVLATKTMATDYAAAQEQLAISLKNLRTDYIDVIQLHNPEALSDPTDPKSAYAALADARRAGVVRHIGLTNHRLELAVTGVRSGLFDTLQFPLSYLSTSEELELIGLCRECNVGLIAMKALAGGLLTNIRAAFAFLRRFDNVVPIWGIQREAELDEFLALEANPPEFSGELVDVITRDRQELSGAFCRGCGYCLPCPAEIPIHWAARMPQLLRRAPVQGLLTAHWQEQMARIENCTECGACASRCPYRLDTPQLLKEALVDYRSFL
ncbi:MAG TPA: aldo/keto reductase [Polyangiaceae bacterium]|nr:aldo/keto reductase [Polyangiaceae bacterium]